MLHEIHPQHPFQTDRRAAVAFLRIVRLDHAAQIRPWNHPLHRLQERIALGRPAVLLVLGVLIIGHREGLLLHVIDNAESASSVDLISVALVS